jgi:hypothetical protein
MTGDPSRTSLGAQAEMVFHRGNGAEPETINPHKSTGVPEANIEADIFEGLTTYAADGAIIPGGAESWEISDDGKVYTFKLRQNAKWSNGDPVTAADLCVRFPGCHQPEDLPPITRRSLTSSSAPPTSATQKENGSLEARRRRAR